MVGTLFHLHRLRASSINGDRRTAVDNDGVDNRGDFHDESFNCCIRTHGMNSAEIKEP